MKTTYLLNDADIVSDVMETESLNVDVIDDYFAVIVTKLHERLND